MALPVKNTNEDTIAAAATAMTEAGIGIIRVSGPEAFSACDRIFRNAAGKRALLSYAANTIHFGHIVDPESPAEAAKQMNIVDEVMISVMKSPHSYTTEDTVEINSHGGVYVMNRILQLVLDQGVRLAEPGEFTKRAFFGGRIDLAEAEAVMDMISSQNEFAMKTAARQMTGEVSSKICSLRERVLHELAFIEAAIDDPENYDTESYPEILHTAVAGLIEEMDALLLYADDSRIIKEGVRTAIIGRPNAGKSSLMNYLVGSERAIVTEIAGTTRDTLEESVRIGGALLHLTDTAGIRETEDIVEQIGVGRARQAIEDADLVIFVIDASLPLSAEEKEIAEAMEKALHRGAKGIVLLNKSDLVKSELALRETEKEAMDLFHANKNSKISSPLFLSASLLTGSGMGLLKEEILRLFHVGELKERNEPYLVSRRHAEAVSNARRSLDLVRQSIEAGLSEDFYSIDLMNCYAELGKILGEQVEDDLAEEIFSKFCLGK
ncbi:tRNA uridine-5-carboxymethylaminomethyl(34) synthesis GTPase MnmE [Lachnoclostridium sp. Marseille-P6806]|uniref:tRNA uridine-5-carboxymethylaminomethyl(34) synthesis GTPase MnmE n=1 Tax=Lachnoclostridium sp. Marseille-P6806 TaxID=2364793 RepID=UPI0010309B4E|nr:tRNA uridine-5-carboxymethylaminomethyl(34) synthesis GTPase MnmE [Lachnoclostridium sp. Marseille-P6806]